MARRLIFLLVATESVQLSCSMLFAKKVWTNVLQVSSFLPRQTLAPCLTGGFDHRLLWLDLRNQA